MANVSNGSRSDGRSWQPKLDRTPFTLGVGEARRVKFRINIPVGVFPGGYFGSILFQLVPGEAPDGSTVITQSGRAGTLLIMTIEGDVKREGRIADLTLTENKFSATKKLRALYENTGSITEKPLGVAYKPAGTIAIKNMLGLPTLRKDITGETVFPQAKRRFETQFAKPIWFGRYTAAVSLSPGVGQPAETRTVSFWAVSPLGIVLALIILAGIIIGGFILLKRRRDGAGPTQGVSLLGEVKKRSVTKRAKRRRKPDDS